VPVRYLKLCTTDQPKLPCSWRSHHYLCANYTPCKPAKLVAHQFLQGRSCCKILSYGVKRMAPSLPVLLSAMPSFRVSHSQSSQPLFLLFSEHNGRPGLLSCWHPQVKLNGRGPSSFVCHALFPCFTRRKVP
jgi:hypothetical protein